MPKRPAKAMIEEEFGVPRPVEGLAQAAPAFTETAPPETTPRKRGGKPQE